MQQQEQVRVAVQFEGEQGQELLFSKTRDAYVLLDYDKMRKKILQSYKYKASDIALIQLTLNNFYPHSTLAIPIHHPKNYKFLLADMLGRDHNSLSLTVRPLGELVKRKRRERQAPIEFDSDGSVESVENEEIKQYLTANTPSMQPFKDKKKPVRCCFCKRSSQQGGESKAAGPFYGPLLGKHYAHLLCLLWCSEVYLNENGSIEGVKVAIDRALKKSCSYCLKKGASFFCHRQECSKSGHYRCAVLHDWDFDWRLYKTYCPKCAERQVPMQEAMTQAIEGEGCKREEGM